MNKPVETFDLRLIQDDDDNFVAVRLDYIDFIQLLHEGKRKNSAFFIGALQSLEKLENNKDTDIEEMYVSSSVKENNHEEN